MPANYVPKVLQDLFPDFPFASFISTAYQVPKYIFSKVLGLMRVVNPTVDNVAKAYENSNDISHIVRTAAYENVVLYAAPVMGVKLLFEPAIRSYAPIVFPAFIYVEESVLIVMAVSMLASNLCYNIALTGAVGRHLPAADDVLPDCQNCDAQASLSSDVANLFLYSGLLGSASALNLFAHVMPEDLIWLLQSTAYGYSLGGLQYSLRGVCLNHYSPMLNNNKIYYISLGAMVIYSVKQTSALLTKMTGMQPNFYVDDAIFNLVWHQAFLLVALQSKSPDYLNIIRSSIKDLQVRALDYVLNYRLVSKNRDYVTKLHGFLGSESGKWLLARKPLQLVLSVNQERLLTVVNWLEWMNENKLAKFAVDTSSFVIDRLPKTLTGKARIIASLLQQQDWKKMSGLAKGYLNEVELQREMKESCVKKIEKFQVVQRFDNTQMKAPDSNSLFAGKASASPKSTANEEEFVDVGRDENNASPVLVEAPKDRRGHTVTYVTRRK